MKRSAIGPAVATVLLAVLANAGTDQTKRGPQAAGPAAEVRTAIMTFADDLAKLEESHRNLMDAVRGLDDLYLKLVGKAREVGRLAEDAKKKGGQGTAQLFEATKQMQEMQMSFNLKYLMLQNKISHENRQFSMVSNIMKNKHDTAKNSINNIR